MASKSQNVFCGTCSRRSKSTKALRYCTDCEDALCSECLDVHGTIKACASHHIIDVNVIDGSPLIVNKSCEVHPDMVLELFCSNHDTLCCRSCMASDHRSCEKLMPIEVASKGVKRSTMYEEISNDVRILNTAVNELEDKKRKSMFNLNDSKEIVQQEVTNLKKQLQKRIQELEAVLMSEIDKMHTNLSKKSSVDLEKICDRQKKIQNISEQFKSVTTHGSESQIFMFIHKMKNELNCQANDFEDLCLSQKDVSLSFIESDSLSFIKSFGSVEMKEASLDIKYKPFKGQQAQNLQQQRKIPAFKLDVKFKAAGAIIAGIGVTKDNRLFLCNQTDSTLYVMSDKGQQLETIQMEGKQWGIAMEEEKKSAWITLPDKHSVQAVNVVTMKKKGQLIKSPGRCHGIALIDDQITVGSYGIIYIMSKTGEIKKTLDVGGSEVHSISVGKTHQLYFAHVNSIGNSTPKSVGLDGTVTSFSAENVNGLIGVEHDRIGNAYLLEYHAENLKLFSFEDKSIKTILTKKDGLNNPYDFAFSKDSSKLFISNSSSREILVFLCT